MPNPFVTYMVLRAILRAVPGRILIAGAVLFLLLGTVLIATGHGAPDHTPEPTRYVAQCPLGYYQIPGTIPWGQCVLIPPYVAP